MLSTAKAPSNQLGINGKSINRSMPMRVSGVFIPQNKESRFAKYELQRTAAAILYKPETAMQDQHRTCWCHRGTASATEKVSIYRQNDGESSRMHGVTTCKSVWACPVCSAKICAVRQSELSTGMKNWVEQGGYVFLMTLTFPHEREMRLTETLPKFTKAKAYFKNCKTYKRILSKGQRKGSVTSLEVTLGEANGWHPHQHDLVFCKPETFGKINEAQGGKLTSSEIDELKGAWYVALLRVGLCEQHQVNDVLAHGLDVRGGQYAAEYIAKFGKDQKWGLSREVTMHAAKVGSDNKGAHPFQLLAWAANGDGQAQAQFREYVEAFEGKRMLSWSRGLKKELTGLDDTTDEEAAEQKMPEESLIGSINSEDLSVLQSRKLLANFLAYVATYCDRADDAQAEIDEYITWARSLGRAGQGVVKTKMWSRGFMFSDKEVAA